MDHEKDLIQKVADKYKGEYAIGDLQTGHMPTGALKYQKTQATFHFKNYDMIVLSNEDGHTGFIYTLVVHLNNSPKKNTWLYPRSAFGKIMHKIGYQPIKNKYKTGLSKQLFELIRQDYKLESLLISHSVSILFKEDNTPPKLVISPLESVLELNEMDELIELASRFAKCCDSVN